MGVAGSLMQPFKDKTKRVACAEGAILLELLLSMTLFLVVLLPLTRFLVRTAGTDRTADVVAANHLAREHLEILRQDPSSTQQPDPVTMNNRLYRITRKVMLVQKGFYTLTVQVFRGSENHPLATVTTRVFDQEAVEFLPDDNALTQTPDEAE